MQFRNREDAAQHLVKPVRALGKGPMVIAALARGGVALGVVLAKALNAELKVVLVRKIGAPGQRELAVAAVAEGPGDGLVLDAETMAYSGASPSYVEHEARRERSEIARRRAAYLGGRAPAPLEGKTVVVVDDGIATGTTVRAALQALRARRPARVVLAVPVASAHALSQISPLVDEWVCLSEPPDFYAVGAHYDDFRQVSDDEVIAALKTAAAAAATHPRAP